ncbi:serine/threonine protein kinase [Rhizocola hellebori]|uniref:non-specific serine/threonine protein kinase n=1 Tax=Rhizocola hellebori TaxID=1392758 RepID=A0A8J3Q9E7_9ACTN|nr:Stk1 family PASTA domain-containing Ser/Thr kinase [Rhizocola hellebori]GIH05884.1 serine/threonine protein kinase [Rhizocola hellebori]
MNAQARLLGGRYQVGELLGYGGMAEVHRGRDLRLGRDVAIKMLRTDLARDNTFQMRFRREAQNAAALNHPAIVAVYDTGEERAATGEVLPYIVMEFVAGRTLKEVLAAEGRIMPRRALEMTADICAALEFSHRHGIIHRDIKPGNVMLTPNGQVKVMDFGIARALASGATTMTQTSAVIGTAQYLSPEQARGEAVDARSDVYAAGCVLFELLCGHPPFVGDSPVAVAYQHVREDPRPPSDSNREVTPDIDSVVLKALAKNPINRYQSSAEMRADVLRAAAGRPVLATPLMREEETAQLNSPARAGTGRTTPARVGDARRRKASGWAIAALSTLGVLAAVALTVGLILANKPPDDISVPSLLGMTQPEAEAKLRSVNLTPLAGVPRFGDCTKDKVVDQTPKSGAQLGEGKEVTFVVCGGVATTQVPNLVGFNKPAAQAKMTEVKLVAEFVEVDGEPATLGQVLSTNPPAGTGVAENTKIIINISKGNMKPVPNVLGKPELTAKAELEAAGFKVDIKAGETFAAGSSNIGKVVRQDPTTGEGAKPADKTTVTIFIGQGPPPVTPTATAGP